jgi:hypothetical protein
LLLSAADFRKAKYRLLAKAWESPPVWKCHESEETHFRILPFCRTIPFNSVFIRQTEEPSTVITVSYRNNGTGSAVVTIHTTYFNII